MRNFAVRALSLGPWLVASLAQASDRSDPANDLCVRVLQEAAYYSSSQFRRDFVPSRIRDQIGQHERLLDKEKKRRKSIESAEWRNPDPLMREAFANDPLVMTDFNGGKVLHFSKAVDDSEDPVDLRYLYYEPRRGPAQFVLWAYDDFHESKARFMVERFGWQQGGWGQGYLYQESPGRWVVAVDAKKNSGSQELISLLEAEGAQVEKR